eukprot:UN16066
MTHSKPIFELPASDSKCLEAFSVFWGWRGIPFSRKLSCYYYSSLGPLPHFQQNNVVHGYSTYVDWIKKFQNPSANLDSGLKPQELVLSRGLQSLVRRKLHLAVEYMYWIDSENSSITKIIFKQYTVCCP